MADVFRGTIPEVIRNADGVYEGDLVHYFRIVWGRAQNVQLPYHNFRHMLHVFWLCHDACRYYGSCLSKREWRNLLIAALFHDFDHPGIMGNDDLNILRALRGLQGHLLPEDEPFFEEIAELIRGTEFPHKTPANSLSPAGRILRDADLAQAFSDAWIQSIIFGLAAEWGKTPREVLDMEVTFFRSLTFSTPWAKDRFPQERIDAKIAETLELIRLLDA